MPLIKDIKHILKSSQGPNAGPDRRDGSRILMVAELPASFANLSTLTHENSGPHTKGGTLTPHLHPQTSEPRGDRRRQVTPTKQKVLDIRDKKVCLESYGWGNYNSDDFLPLSGVVFGG